MADKNILNYKCIKLKITRNAGTGQLPKKKRDHNVDHIQYKDELYSKKRNLVVKLETAQSAVAQAFLFHHVTMSRTSGRLQMHG